MIAKFNCDILRNHVESLCEKHNITIIYEECYYIVVDGRISPQGGAFSSRAKIRINHITTPELYVVAMHEIGHCVAKRGMPHPSFWIPAKNALTAEVEAWRWALSHAKVSRQYVLDVAKDAMRGYLESAKKWKRVYIPKSRLLQELVA